MKRIAIFLIMILIFALVIAQTSPPKEKEYTVSLTLPQWQMVLEVIDNSTSPHSEVKSVQAMIVQPVQRQIVDTIPKTKK